MNNNLDDFVKLNGEVINEDSLQTVEKEKIIKKLNTFAYEDTNTPIPGESVDYKIDEQINSITEDTALDSLIIKAAIAKAKNENEEMKKSNTLSKEQKLAMRKQFIDMMMYEQGELYYQQHGYIMDGKTKRGVRKRIERNYDKGRYKKYQQSLNG